MRFPLLRTRPGRLFLLTSILLLGILGLQSVADATSLGGAILVLRKLISLAWIVSVVWFGMLVLRHYRQTYRLGWFVRHKLILSYLCLGLVPVVLVGAFVFAVSVLLYTEVAAYVFREGIRDVTDEVQHVAETAAFESTAAGAGRPVLESMYATLKNQSPDISLALVPVPSPGPAAVITAGPWRDHAPPPSVPAWVMAAHGYRGWLVMPASGASTQPQLIMRSAVPAANGKAVAVVDLPANQAIVDRILSKTGMTISDITAGAAELSGSLAADPPVAAVTPIAARGMQTPFRQTRVPMEFLDWQSGQRRVASIGLEAPLSRLYARLVESQPGAADQQTGQSAWVRFVGLMAVFGIMLLILQMVFLWAGWGLARSITSAVHELFAGTERVQRGEFGRPIAVSSHDQLGELADSFNRMSVSIEHAMKMEREKQRLDDELRIARAIQESLLPSEPPVMAGISIAAMCEPAREVGGDYYDFFELGPRQLGVLIADVSGKGTSAALYMAELKGLMLALHGTEPSPRRLLITVNRLLAAHLDNRSFITMTYAVIDLEAMTLTTARAGHTPLIVSSGGASEVIISDGMVLGLRLPGACERFEGMLEEHTRRLAPGDLVALYTDGITEAMDTASELFGDATLARILADHQHLDAAAVRDRVLREVRAFVGEAEPHDDMTMVVLKLAESPS